MTAMISVGCREVLFSDVVPRFVNTSLTKNRLPTLVLILCHRQTDRRTTFP